MHNTENFLIYRSSDNNGKCKSEMRLPKIINMDDRLALRCVIRTTKQPFFFIFSNMSLEIIYCVCANFCSIIFCQFHASCTNTWNLHLIRHTWTRKCTKVYVINKTCVFLNETTVHCISCKYSLFSFISKMQLKWVKKTTVVRFSRSKYRCLILGKRSMWFIVIVYSYIHAIGTINAAVTSITTC